jgi:predicted nucleotidyltransferase
MTEELIAEIQFEQRTALERISEILGPEKSVLSARVYGSFLYGNSSADLDMAIMAKSNSGFVDISTYQRLLQLRYKLCRTIDLDVDLIPHTEDEVTERGSTLWNPRYHPSLKFGLDVKNSFPVPETITEM